MSKCAHCKKEIEPNPSEKIFVVRLSQTVLTETAFRVQAANLPIAENEPEKETAYCSTICMKRWLLDYVNQVYVLAFHNEPSGVIS